MRSIDTTRTVPQDLARLVERHVAQQTWGRVHRLRAEQAADQVVVYGCVPTYYLKQLALKAALDVLISAPAVELVMHIQVASARLRVSHA